MNLNSQTYHQLPLATAPKIHTDLLWDLSFLFIGLAAVYFICVFFYRNRISGRNRRVKHRKKELSPMISEFLFHEEEASKDEKSNYVNLKIEIRQLLKDDFNRMVLSEVLLDLRKDVAGDTQKRLFKLYQDLGLHNDDFEKLKSWRWEIVSKAILNLTQMQVAEAYSFITKFINDKRHTIRKQAEIAVVTLKPEGINYFLDTTKFKISEWQQLKLMDVLRNEENYQPPRFKAWLTSTNRHVVLFALRLIKYYNQNDADAALIELVKHKNNQIKEEAIGCIKEFHIVEALSTLKLVFWKSSTDVKISILGAIGVLGGEKDLAFLHLIEKKESNFSVQSKAHSSINSIAPDSIMPSKGLLNTSNYKIPDDIEIKEEELEESDVTKYLPNTTLTNETLELSKAAIDTEINNVLVENQEPEHQETDDEKVDFQENKILSFDFLPLVVPEVLDTEIENSKEENMEISLYEIAVNFEEVKPPEKKIPFVEITAKEIAFLPIIIDNEEDTPHKNDVQKESQNTISINEIEVQFETITPLNEIEVQCDTIVATNAIEVQSEDEQVRSLNQKSEFLSDYSRYQTFEILDIAVIYDEISLTKKTSDLENWPLLEFGEEFVDTTNKPEIKVEEIEETPLLTEKTIPKAIHSDAIFDDIILYEENTEESHMRLLDDLTEMGDQRELPLLYELLVNEKYETVKNRVKQLIEKFSGTSEEPDADALLKPFNVFEDLFRTCDTEAKLILMDEIVAVGDEAEIDFLEGLLENHEREISNKAARILEELKAKLSAAKKNEVSGSIKVDFGQTEISEIKVLIEEETLAEYDSLMEELQIAPPQNSEIFDLNFELTEPVDETTEDYPVEKDRNPESFFSQICTFSNKIIDRLNG